MAYYYWKGGAGEFGNPSNWDVGATTATTAPSLLDNTYIDVPASISGGSANSASQADYLMVSADTYLTGSFLLENFCEILNQSTLTILSRVTVTTEDPFDGGLFVSSGTVYIGDDALLTSAPFFVGVDGLVTVSAGGQLDTPYAWPDFASVSGTVNVTGAASEWNCGGGLLDNGSIAVDGGKLLTLSAQNPYTSQSIEIGSKSGGFGKLTIENGGSLINGPSVSADDALTVGDGAGADGSILITGSGSLLNCPRIEIGALGGAGVVTVEQGASVIADDIFVSGIDNNSSSGALIVLDTATVSAKNITLNFGGFLEIDATSFNGSIAFADPTAQMQIDGVVMPSNAISGFVGGDTIDLKDVAYDSSGSVALMSDGALVISENEQTYELQFGPDQIFEDQFNGDYFALASDGGNGTEITLYIPPLFTTGADDVDFNDLTNPQQAAIGAGANIYDGLGGDDVIILPDVVYYDQFLLNGKTLGWTNTAASTFSTGSRLGDTYRVLGGDGDYFIDEGAGTEFITIDGDGNSQIAAGSGDDTISITGDGDNSVTAGTGALALTVAGSGVNTLNGALNGSATISAGGTLQISADFTGVAAIGDSSTLAIAGSINAGASISFTVDGQGYPSTGTGTLTLSQMPSLAATIKNFAAGDTIDLKGIAANEDYFDPNTGVLTLYDAKFGQSAAVVGSLNLFGDYDAYAFTLSSDGNGGTDIKLGDAAPTLGQLANLAAAAYAPANNVAGFTLFQANSSGFTALPGGTSILTASDGFSASIYYEGDANDPDQIVIAIRGTFLSNLLAAVKNLLADSAFTTSSLIPNFNLDYYVALASQVLAAVRSAFPYANITLTGHSLGGAIAALVGDASDYPVATFNAPGAAQLVSSLGFVLKPAASANSELPILSALPSNSPLPELDTAYRLEGDQVSLAGAQLGYIETIANNQPTGWLSALANHDINRVIADLNNKMTGGAEIPDQPLPKFITSAASALVGRVVTWTFGAVNVVEGVLAPFDPSAAASYTMTEQSGSPLFASLALPEEAGVASYQVSLETGTTWSTPEILAPGATLTPSTPFDGFEFTPLDSSGQPVEGASFSILDLTFASSGTFNGTLTMLVNTATVAEFLAGQATLDQTAGGFYISDSAAEVTANLGALNADPNIDAIYFSDATPPTLTLSSAEVSTDIDALSLMASAFSIAVTDVSASISADIDALQSNGHVTSIVLADPSDPVTLTDAQYANDKTTLARIGGAHQIDVTNVSGKIYTAYAIYYDIDGEKNEINYTGIASAAFSSYFLSYSNRLLQSTTYVFTSTPAGAAYSSYQTDYSAASSFTGSQFFYTDIAGEPFTGEEVSYDAYGKLQSALFTGIAGAAYSSYRQLYAGGIYVGTDFTVTAVPAGAAFSSYEIDYNGANIYAGEKVFFSHVSGEPYTQAEYDYDAGGDLSRFGALGFAGGGYSSVVQTYVAGIFDGAVYTVTSVPSGAPYAYYELDYNYAGDFTGEQEFSQGSASLGYAQKEVDTNAAGEVTAILETGVTGQAFTSVEYDYSAGVYEGYKAYYTGLTKAFTSEEIDVDASNQTTKILESGITAKPYSSMEIDYVSGAVADTIDFFANVTGQSYFADQIELSPAKVQIKQTFDNNDGSHTMTGLNGATGLTFDSLANDTMTGGAGGETFLFSPAFGHDAITDFANYSDDSIALSTGDFANWTALINSATNVSGGVEIIGATGDTLTLLGLTTSTLAAHQAQFRFTA